MSDELARLRIQVLPEGITATTTQLQQLTSATRTAEQAAGAFGMRNAKTTEAMIVQAQAFQSMLAKNSAEAAALAGVMDGRLLGAAKSAAGALTAITASAAGSKVAIGTLATTGVAAFGELAATLVPGGVLAGAITYGGAKLVEYFTTARNELQKTQEEFTSRLEKMRQSADAGGITTDAFRIQQQLDPLKARLAQAQQRDFGGLTVGEGLNARRTLPDQIAALQKELDAAMTAATTVAAQYSQRAIAPTITVTVDTPEAIAKRQATAAQAAAKEAARIAKQHQDDVMQSLADDARIFKIATDNRALQLRKRGELVGGGIATVSLGAGASASDLVEQNLTGVIGGSERGKSELDTAIRRGRDAIDQAKALTQSFSDGLSRALSDGIYSGFKNGTKSLTDFGNALRDTLERALSEVLASKIMQQIFGGLQGLSGAGGGGRSIASGGGALGAVGMLGGLFKSGGKTTNIAKGGGGLGAGLLAGGLGFGLGATLGQSGGTTVGALGGAASGAASGAVIGSIVPGLGTVLGGVIGGAAGLLGGLFGGGAKKAKAKAAAEQLAQDSVDFADELIARSLTASGDTFGAEMSRLKKKQADEMTAVQQRFGKNSKQATDLAGVQQKERDALSASTASTEPSGTYLAPAGFDAANYRFEAGRPMGDVYRQKDAGQSRNQGTTITGTTINVTLPNGTTEEMARGIMRHLTTIAGAQGVSHWSEVYAN